MAGVIAPIIRMVADVLTHVHVSMATQLTPMDVYQLSEEGSSEESNAKQIN